jgi:hypothetical protein
VGALAKTPGPLTPSQARPVTTNPLHIAVLESTSSRCTSSALSPLPPTSHTQGRAVLSYLHPPPRTGHLSVSQGGGHSRATRRFGASLPVSSRPSPKEDTPLLSLRLACKSCQAQTGQHRQSAHTQSVQTKRTYTAWRRGNSQIVSPRLLPPAPRTGTTGILALAPLLGAMP